MLSYAMNSWFGCHSHPVRIMRDRHGDRRNAASVASKNSSRMALFVEIDEEGPNTSDDHAGQEADGKEAKKRVFSNDCVWDWQQEGDVETSCFLHYKANGEKKEWRYYTHVVFLDGHVASVNISPEIYKQDVNPESTESSIEGVFKRLGRGEY